MRLIGLELDCLGIIQFNFIEKKKCLLTINLAYE